jgi:hypothetical protein
MSRIRRIAPGLGRGGLLGNTEGPESYLRELDTLPSQFCRATGGTETVISQGGKFYRVHTFTDTDPTSLLLNFDGSNGSTTFTDDSGWGHAVTANGGAAISTTESKFGGSSGYFDGTGDYLTVPYAQDWNLAAVDFTIESWIRTSDTSSAYPSFVGRWQGTGEANWDFRHRSVDIGNVVVFVYSVDGTNPVIVQTNVSVTDGEWHHVAACRSGSSLRLFVDGVLSATHSIGNSVISNNSNVPLYVGYDPFGSSYFNGYIDSLRITKGQARYTAAFTPPQRDFLP